MTFLVLSRMSSLKYRPDIDGLRAVAVLMVVLYHAGSPWFRGGYIGVDVFFVISGYLITSIIRSELGEGVFSFAQFWQRRIRRILPALLVVTLCTLIAGWFLFLPEDYAKLAKSAAAQAVFASNIQFYHTSGYFAADNATKPLLHTWSLAVEEQFYVFFPFLSVALCKKAGRKTPVLLAVLAAVSFFSELHVLGDDKNAVFYLLPYRAWELLTGALLTYAGTPKDRPWSRAGYEMLAAGGLLAVLLPACFFYDDHTAFPGYAALAPCLGAAALIYANGQCRTLVASALSWRPVVFGGLVSYSFYLWHWPLLCFPDYLLQYDFTGGRVVAAVTCSFILACLSWRFVERPMRRRAAFQTSRAAYGAAFAALAMLALAGLVIVKFHGFPQRFSPAANLYAQGAQDFNHGRDHCEKHARQIKKDKVCETNPDHGISPSFVLWGDSHGDAFSPLFTTLSAKYRKNGYLLTQHGCPPFLDVKKGNDDCLTFNAETVRFIDRHKIGNVFLIAKWTGWMSSSQMDFTGGDWYSEAYKKRYADIRVAALQRTIDLLRAKGIKVYVLVNNAPMAFNPPRALALREMFGLEWKLSADAAAFKNDKTASIGKVIGLNRDPGTVFVDSKARLCPGSDCIVASDGHSLYYDDDHLSVYGTNFIGPLIEPFFRRLP